MESPLKLWASCRDTFQVYKNREFTIKIKTAGGNKNKERLIYDTSADHFTKSTLFFHEAIWNLLIHGGDQGFPVVFEPCGGGRGEDGGKAKRRQRADI